MENMEKLLPEICDENIIENENFVLKKIAKFNYPLMIHIYGDEWHLRIDYELKYTLFDKGKHIKKYQKIFKDDINEEITEADQLFIDKYKDKYVEIEPLGDDKYKVKIDRGIDFDSVRIVDQNDDAVSEDYNLIFAINHPYITKRWIDKKMYAGSIDRGGKTIIEKRFFVPHTHGIMFSEEKRRLLFCKNNQFGVVDFDGNIVVMPKYRDITDIYADLMVGKIDEIFYLLGEDGTELMSGNFITSIDNMVVIYDENEHATVYEYIKKKNIENQKIPVESIYEEADYQEEKKMYDMEMSYNLYKKRLNKRESKLSSGIQSIE